MWSILRRGATWYNAHFYTFDFKTRFSFEIYFSSQLIFFYLEMYKKVEILWLNLCICHNIWEILVYSLVSKIVIDLKQGFNIFEVQWFTVEGFAISDIKNASLHHSNSHSMFKSHMNWLMIPEMMPNSWQVSLSSSHEILTWNKNCSFRRKH